MTDLLPLQPEVHATVRGDAQGARSLHLVWPRENVATREQHPGSSIAAVKTPVLRARSASSRKARQLASSKKRTAVGPMIWTNEAAM